MVARVVELNVVWKEHTCFEQSTLGRIMLGSRRPADSSLPRMIAIAQARIVAANSRSVSELGLYLLPG